VTEVHFFNAVSGNEYTDETKYFVYDSDGIGNGSYAMGRLSEVKWGRLINGEHAYRELYSFTVGGRVKTKRLALRKSYQSKAYATFYSYRNLDANYTYDNEGHPLSVSYPLGGPAYTYSLDAMGRPVTMTDGAGDVWAKEAQYDGAGRLAQIKLLKGTDGTPSYATEQHGYNALGQLTRLTIPGYLDEEYTYPATGNAGRIERKKDWVSGEEVAYQYDELNRLTHAATTGPEWGLSFSHDGFGNRTAQTVTKGAAPAWSGLVDAATNRVLGYYEQYDANGNLTRTAWPGSGSSMGMVYDRRNRLVRVVSPDGNEQYEYTPGGERIYRRRETAAGTAEWYYFYGADGRLLAAYKQNGDQAFDLQLRRRKTYFMGKLTHEWAWPGYEGLAVVDRLGSVRHSPEIWSASYYPYGEEQGAGTADDQEKFATYSRDSFSGFDYARQRYYSSRTGRFLTADPYRASGGAGDPGSWNRYAYVEGDPVNFGDPSGLQVLPAPYLGVGIYCTTVWGAEGSSYECSPEFAYTMEYFGQSTLDEETQSGGGGGSPLPYPVDYGTQNWARGKLLMHLVDFESTNCGKVFGEAGIDLGKLRSLVRSTRFYDMRDGSYSGLRVNQLVGGKDSRLAGSMSGDAYHFGGPGGNAVGLFSGFYGPVGAQSGYFYNVQTSTLLHEVIHGLRAFRNDSRIANNAVFNRNGLQNWTTDSTVGNSHHFSLWLANDCRRPPPGWQ